MRGPETLPKFKTVEKAVEYFMLLTEKRQKEEAIRKRAWRGKFDKLFAEDIDDKIRTRAKAFIKGLLDKKDKEIEELEDEVRDAEEMAYMD